MDLVVDRKKVKGSSPIEGCKYPSREHTRAYLLRGESLVSGGQDPWARRPRVLVARFWKKTLFGKLRHRDLILIVTRREEYIVPQYCCVSKIKVITI